LADQLAQFTTELVNETEWDIFAKLCVPAHLYFEPKLTPGINFINILKAAFACKDPKSAKRHLRLDCIFALLRFFDRKSWT